MRKAHNALHSVAWFVAEADGTVRGEMASGNIQTVCAFPTDLSASKSFAGTAFEAAGSRIDGELELCSATVRLRIGKASLRSGAISDNASARRPITASGRMNSTRSGLYRRLRLDWRGTFFRFLQ